MPIFETLCVACNHVSEHYYSRGTSPALPCDACGKETVFIPSTFNAPWTGDLSRFIDPKASMHNQTNEGHWAYRVKSSRMANGAPEKVLVRTRQDQKELMKAEGLSDPFEANLNDKPTADGTQSSSRPRGAWV